MGGQASAPLKGKASRMLAAKAALACRADALAESIESALQGKKLDKAMKTKFEALNNGMLGAEGRAKVEARLRMLETGEKYQLSGTGKAMAKHEKYEAKSEIGEYKTAADNTMGSAKKRKIKEEDDDDEEVVEKKVKVEAEDGDAEGAKKKKKKKKNKEQDESNEENATPNKKSKSENGANGHAESPEMNGDATESAKKKKKKKKN